MKNFRPNFLVLTGAPTERPALCDLSACLAKNRCLMICANVLDEYNDLRPIMVSEYYKWLRNRKIKSFYTEVTSSSLRVGVSTMMQVKLSLNFILAFNFFIYVLEKNYFLVHWSGKIKTKYVDTRLQERLVHGKSRISFRLL